MKRSDRYRLLLPLIAGAALLAALAGCGDGNAAAHPNFRKAELCREAGDYEAAMGQLRRFMASRPNSPEGHLAMASLCDENLNDPLGAVYHYREFLRLAPDSPHAEMARAWMNAAMEKLRTTVETSPEERQALEQEIARLKQQNLRLTRLFHARRGDGLQTVPPTAPARHAVSEPPPGRGRTAVAGSPAAVRKEQRYRVRQGDTLGLIARRFYGSSAQFRRIMEANGLKPDSVLRIGQELNIPPLPNDQ